MQIQGLVPNLIVPALVVVAGIFLLLSAEVTNTPEALSKKHKTNTTSFLYWLVWWVTIIFVYLTVHDDASKQRVPLSMVIAVLDAGGISLAIAAITYCAGSDITRRATIIGIGVWIILCMYYLVLDRIGGSSADARALVATWMIAPSAVIANISIAAIGWCFWVRWGATALPFVVISLVYAVAQIPAYFNLFVVKPELGDLQHAVRIQSIIKSDVFEWLAIGKFLLAAFPLIYFTSGDTPGLNLGVAKYWPEGDRIKLSPTVVRWAGWLITTIGTAFATSIAKGWLSDKSVGTP